MARGHPLNILWAALWRAQALHLLLFGLVPIAIAVLDVAFGIVILPFSLLSFGDRTLSYGEQALHLREPGCWVMLAPCTVADINLVALPWSGLSIDHGSPQLEPPVEPFIDASLPDSLTPKYLWFFGWLLWFLVFLHRQRPR